MASAATVFYNRGAVLRHGRREKAAADVPVFFASYLALLCLMVMLFLLYVWQPLQVVKRGYQVQKLAELRDVLKAEDAVLSLEYSSLIFSERIGHIARKKLAMQVPQEGQVIIVGDKKLLEQK